MKSDFDRGFEAGVIHLEKWIKENSKQVSVSIYNTHNLVSETKWVVADKVDDEIKAMLEKLFKQFVKEEYEYANSDKIQEIRKKEHDEFLKTK